MNPLTSPGRHGGSGAVTPARRQGDGGPATLAGMFDLATRVAEHHRSLEGWLRTALPGADIGWGRPTDDGAGVVIMLDDVRGAPDRRNDRELPLRLDLTYVLTTSGEPDDVATTLAVIVAAARHHGTYQLTDPPSEDWWLAAGMPRRPAMRLSSRLVVEPDLAPAGPPVRERRFEVTRTGRVSGTLTRAGLPLGGAEVGCLGSVERSRTDRHGRFELTGVDATRPIPVVIATGRSRFAATIPAGVGEPQIVCPDPSTEP